MPKHTNKKTGTEEKNELLNILGMILLDHNLRNKIEEKYPVLILRATQALQRSKIDLFRIPEINEDDIYHLGRDINIYVCMDGTITYGLLGLPSFNGAALPVHSVDTVKEAELIQRTLGKLQWASHPLMSEQPWYVLSNFGHTTDDLPGVARRMQDISKRYKETYNTSKQIEAHVIPPRKIG